MASRNEPQEDLELPPILSPFPARENANLPSIGLDISRPPSACSQASSHYVQKRPSPRFGVQLPGLSQISGLTSATSSRRGSPDSVGTASSSHLPFQFSIPPSNMSSPAVATAGLGGSIPVCQNCATSTTPMWRRDEHGTVLCNACGLFLKLHGRPRPISLKTDTIKSRNRARIQGEIIGARTKSTNAQATNEPSQAAHKHTKRAKLTQQTAAAALHRARSPSARVGTLGNIAPQSMFDSVAVDSHNPFSTTNASIAESLNRLTSPSRIEDPSSSILQENQLSYEQLLKEATRMQTRINELDVINVLFRGRVEELEASQQAARNNEIAARQAEQVAVADLNVTRARESELQRRIVELERQANTRGTRSKAGDAADEDKDITKRTTTKERGA